MPNFIFKFCFVVVGGWGPTVSKRTIKDIKLRDRKWTCMRHADTQHASCRHSSCVMQTDGGWRHLRPVWSRPPWGRRVWSPRPRCWAASWRPSWTLSEPPWVCWCGLGWSAGGKTYPAAKSKYCDDKNVKRGRKQKNKKELWKTPSRKIVAAIFFVM